MSFKIEGYEDLFKKISHIPKALEKTYINVMQKSVLYVRKESQSITPVRTGNLRASARSMTTSSESGADGIVWYKADYAVPVHERTWTKLISGQHKFLEKSVHRSRSKIEEFMSDGIRRTLRRFASE